MLVLTGDSEIRPGYEWVMELIRPGRGRGWSVGGGHGKVTEFGDGGQGLEAACSN